MKTSDTKLITPDEVLVHQEVELLTKKFNGAVDFLKKTKVSVKEDHRSLFNARWFLVIGAPKTGKSALLAHSGLNFVLTKKSIKTEKKILPTRYCDWWVTREAVFLDTAGSFTLHRNNNSTERHLWFHFLDLLSQQKREPVNGVIITVSIERLLLQSKEDQDNHFQHIQARLAEIHQRLSLTIPVYIVFTKADCLAGFCEFFDELTPEDKEQIWGMSFNHLDVLDSQKIADNFDTEFNALLQRVNDRLITRLHQEHDWQKRAKIKDFPNQLENFKNTMALFLQKISDYATAEQQTILRGIYLTSAVPEGNIVDRLLKPLSEGFALTTYESTNTLPAHNIQTHPYFIKAVFQNIIFPDSEYFSKQALLQAQEKKAWLKRSVVYSSLIAVVGAAMLWTHHFAENMDQISVVENAISEYRLLIQSPDSLKAEQALSTLNTLAAAKGSLLDAKFPWLLQFSERQKSLKQEQQMVFAKAVRVIVQTQLENVLKNELAAKPMDPNALYGTLKAYRMLSDSQHFDKQYIENEIVSYWTAVLPSPKISNSAIHQYFSLLKQSDFKDAVLNTSLIKEAQTQLTALDSTKLLEAVISNDYLTQTAPLVLSLNSKDNNFSFNHHRLSQQIPARYTAAYFKTIYEDMIPKAAQDLSQGNWVLGTMSQESALSKDSIITAARNQYMNDYIAAWQNVLNTITVDAPKNYGEAIATADAFINKDSSLNQLLQVVRDNTAIDYDNMPTPISSAFKSLNTIAMATSQSYVSQPLDDFKSYLDSISNASNVSQAAFNFAKQRMETKGQNDAITELMSEDKHVPAPLSDWLKVLANQSWGLILSDTSNYINTVWQNTVIPNFSAKIDNHFPFDKSSDDEVSMDDFNEFFAPNGVISNFFVNYVSPFIDTQNPQWKSIVIDNKSVAFSNDSLKKLQQAALLQNVFYPNGQSTPQVSLSLEPTKLSTDVQNLIVTVDKQATVFTQDEGSLLPITWPTATGTQEISFTMIGKNGTQVDTQVTGLWGWLKLVEQGKLEGTNNPKEVIFALNEQGFSGEYRLESNSPLNPFNPEIYNDFNLPRVL